MISNISDECGVHPVSAFGPPCSGNGECVFNEGFGRSLCICNPGWEGLSDFLVTTDSTDCHLNVVTIQVLNGLTAFFAIVLLFPMARALLKIYAVHKREAKRRFNDSGQVYRIRDNKLFFSLIPFMMVGFPSLFAAAIAKSVNVRLKIGGSVGYTIAILLFRGTFLFTVFYYQVSLVEQLLRPFPEFANFTRENRVSSRITLTLGLSLSAVYIIPFMAANASEFDRSVNFTCAALMAYLNSIVFLFFYVQGRRNMKAIDRFREMNPVIAANARLTTVLERLKENQDIAKKNGILQTLIYGVIMGVAFCAALYQVLAGLRSLVNDAEERERQQRLQAMGSSVNLFTLADLNDLDREQQQEEQEQDDLSERKGTPGRFEISVGHETMLVRFGNFDRDQVLRFAKPYQVIPSAILLSLICKTTLGLETAVFVGALPQAFSFLSLVLTMLWTFSITATGVSIPALLRVMRQTSFWLRGISGLFSMICLAVVCDLDSRTAIAISHVFGLFALLSADAFVKEPSQRMKPIIALFVTLSFFRTFLLIQFDWLEQRTDVRIFLRPFEDHAFAIRWSIYSASRDFCFVLVTLLITGDLRHMLRHPEYAFHLRGKIKLKILKLMTSEDVSQHSNPQIQEDLRFRIISGRVVRPILALRSLSFGNINQPESDCKVEEDQQENLKVTAGEPKANGPAFAEQQICTEEESTIATTTSNTTFTRTRTNGTLPSASNRGIEEFSDLIVLREADALAFAVFGRKRGLQFLQLFTHPAIRVLSYFLFCGPIVAYSCFVLPGVISPEYSLLTLVIFLPVFQSLCFKSTHMMKRISTTKDFKLFLLLKLVVFALFGVLLKGDVRIIALFPLLFYAFDLRMTDARCVFLHPPSTIDRFWIVLSKTVVAILGITLALAILFIPIGLSLGVFVNIDATIVLYLTSSPPPYPEAIQNSDETIFVWSDAPPGMFANVQLVQTVSDVLITILLLSLSDLTLELLYRKGVRVHLRQLTSPVFFRYVDFVVKEEDFKETVRDESIHGNETNNMFSVNDVVRAAVVESTTLSVPPKVGGE